jgi:hypothetical protein
MPLRQANRESLATLQKARRREIVPAPIHEEVVSFGKFVAELFGPAFAGNSRLKYSIGRLLTAQLPPSPQPGGRPAFAIVTAAICAREEAKRRHPERSDKEIWGEIYRCVIPHYETLPAIERREAAQQLRKRTYWRLHARRRRERRKTQP